MAVFLWWQISYNLNDQSIKCSALLSPFINAWLYHFSIIFNIQSFLWPISNPQQRKTEGRSSKFCKRPLQSGHIYYIRVRMSKFYTFCHQRVSKKHRHHDLMHNIYVNALVVKSTTAWKCILMIYILCFLHLQ